MGRESSLAVNSVGIPEPLLMNVESVGGVEWVVAAHDEDPAENWKMHGSLNLD